MDESKFRRIGVPSLKVVSHITVVWLHLRTTYVTRLLPLVMLLTLPVVVQAQFIYTTNNGTITITGYTNPISVVTIPNTINGLPVTSIGIQAFHNKTFVTSITIPDSVTNIGGEAFSYCSGLTSISLGTNVTTIGVLAFNYCGNLSTANIPNSVTGLGAGVFYNCPSLTTVSLGTNLNSIGDFAFAYCSKLTAITIPSRVASIGDSTFLWCNGLTNATIPVGVTSIAASAFQFCLSLPGVAIPITVTNIGALAFGTCSSMTNVFIPSNVTSIGGAPFSTCPKLTGIMVDAQNPNYISLDGVLLTKDQTLLVQFPGGKAGNYTIPNGVTTIGPKAFALCASLTNVTIPECVTNIGGSAFWSCFGLLGAFFCGNPPSSVGDSAFTSNLGIMSVTVYFLPGTIGWGPTFAERPTALWNPQVQTDDASFGVRTNRFGFNIAWASGQVVVVEASENLANPIWSPLQTNTLSGDSLYFSDPEWTNYPGRFYRLRSP